MGRTARRNAEVLLAFNVERKLAGLPICTCHRMWFHPGSRLHQKMTESEKHMTGCGMYVKDVLKERDDAE
jgi:hypothetical protein